MLEMFKKKLGVEQPEVVLLQEHEELANQFNTYKEEAEKSLAEAAAQVAALNSQLQEVQGQLESLKQYAEAAEAAKAEAQAKAEELRLNARKEKIIAAVGTSRADALMAATGTMDDVAFNAIVDALNVSAAAEAGSEMFTEVGAGVKADASKVEDADKPVHFKQYIKQ